LGLCCNRQEILREGAQGGKDALNGMFALFPGGLIFESTFLRFQHHIDFVFELRIGGIYWFTFEFREIKGSPSTFTPIDYFFQCLGGFQVLSCCS